MKVLLLLFISFSTVHARAQTRWTVTHHGAEMLAATTEDTLANRITLRHGDLKKWGTLKLMVTETPLRPDWKRTIFLDDAAQNNGQRQTGNRLKIRNRKLRKLFAQASTLYATTSALPTDPAVAATVRVRRVHLCTLILQ